MASRQLRETQNYVWDMSNVLGRGATSIVYMGQKKCTGEEVAVKVFTQPSDSRTVMIQQREFAVLKMLCHKNVVQLFAMEPEISGNMHVIVMQYCSEGTLYRMLSKPEHAFGLDEDEFIIFLRDITAGMKHLREHQIVHRDIKPGNILCYKADNGRFIYKLTDFGAARALDDNQEFVSLYGTEEYLHPDMYDVAVMKKAMGHKFDAAVDLWSLAVTIYQVATGQLPFQPFGGRKNRPTMHKILSEKKSGVVSGIQKSYGGDIEWSYVFPKTCMLSFGLQMYLLPLLTGLLERDPKKTWNFDQYFSEVQEIVSKKIIHVFSAEDFISYRIYINSKENFTNLQELIALQTEVTAANQLLLFEGRLLYDVVNTQQTVDTYPPNITQEHPIFLIVPPTSKTLTLDARIPPFPLLEQNVHSVDRTVLRNNVGIIFYIKKIVLQLMLKQNLLREALRNFMVFQNQCFVTHRDLPTGAIETMDLIRTFLENMDLSLKDSPERIRIDAILTELEKQQTNFLKNFSDDYQLSSGCDKDAHCVSTIDTLSSRAHELTNRLIDQLNKVNTDQFQELDKSRLQENCKKGESLIVDYCRPNSQKLYAEYQLASEKVWNQRKLFMHITALLTEFNKLFKTYTSSIIVMIKLNMKSKFEVNEYETIVNLIQRVQTATQQIRKCSVMIQE